LIAADDLGVTDLGLSVNGVTTPLNSDGKASVTLANGGLIELFAEATDSADQIASSLFQLIVRNADGSLPNLSGLGLAEGSEPDAPNVRIVTPAVGVIVDQPVEIIGSITGSSLPVGHWQVTGNAKLGNFAVEFTDVELPLAGIPNTIKRTYDSLNTDRSGDFGYGWSLAIQDADLRETILYGMTLLNCSSGSSRNMNGCGATAIRVGRASS
jgi:hypothetical protein